MRKPISDPRTERQRLLDRYTASRADATALLRDRRERVATKLITQRERVLIVVGSGGSVRAPGTRDKIELTRQTDRPVKGELPHAWAVAKGARRIRDGDAC